MIYLIEQKIYQIDFLAPPLRRLSSPLDPSHIFICSILSSAGRHTPFWKQRRWASKVGKAKTDSAGGHIRVEGSSNKKPAFGITPLAGFSRGPVHRLSVLVSGTDRATMGYLRRSSRGRQNAQRTSPKGTDPGATALEYRSVHSLILQPLHLSYYCSQSLLA